MVDLVGFRLRPTEDEMVGCYLYYKLMQRALRDNEFINEINIYEYDPWMLRLQSKVKSRDPIWYFYTRVQNNGNRGGQKRTTPSGFWANSGHDKPVHDKWGYWTRNQGDQIGSKKGFRFLFRGNSGKSDWILHEYHNTMLPEHQTTHVLCTLEYKGDDIRFITDNATETRPVLVQELSNRAGYLVDQSVYVSANQNQDFSGNLNGQEQVPVSVLNGNEMQPANWNYVDEEDFRSEFDELMLSANVPSLVDTCW